MPNPPPRKRFQIHLSTAIVLMFVAGGLMCANLMPFRQPYVGSTTRWVGTKNEFSWRDLDVKLNFEYGLPRTFYVETQLVGKRKWDKDGEFETGGGNEDGTRYRISENELEALKGFPLSDEELKAWNAPLSFSGSIIWSNLFINLAIMVVILAPIGFLCEFLIRRRDAQKES